MWISFWLSVLAMAAPAFAPIPLKEKLPHRDFPRVLDRLGSALLGKPYELGPLGEGAGAPHPKPLYRLDAFDCTTFLETVMANAYCVAQEKRMAACLEAKMREIRYAGGKISFVTRNHIPETDWLPQNERRGFLRDLSGRIFPGEWKKAKVTIDRVAWLAEQGETGAGVPAKGPDEISFLPVGIFFRPVDLKPEERKAAEAKLAEANAASAGEDEDQKTRAKFRAEMEFLKATFGPLPEKLAQIPSGSILNLIRRPAKTAAEAKRQTLVAHQGLVVQRTDGAHILHAAPSGHVRDLLLGDYLRRYVRSAHFQGISLFQILPPR